MAYNGWMRRILFLACVIATFSACGLVSQCGESALLTTTSPNSEWQASVVERNCGATTDYVTLVTVRGNKTYFGSTAEVFLVSGAVGVELEWTTESNLSIRCKDCKESDVFVKKDKWDDLHIKYDEFTK
jgi:hypothetical protein